jgi:DNA-binding response OmpR family regulator
MSVAPDIGTTFDIWVNEGLEFRVCVAGRIGFIDGEKLRLTESEWKILSYLLARSGEYRSRNHILLDALGYQYCGSSRTVDTHIKNLRIKLHSASWIETIRNSGYRFRGVQV